MESKMPSVDPDLESGVKNLNINDKTDVNILLLGETGVGKSTLINALANYITYKDFDVAKKEELLVLIPTEFIATDKSGEFQIIKVGERDEQVDPGVSSTQFIKTHVFPIRNGNAKLRLIDTPGMKSTKGTSQDRINSENILRYIGQLNALHAIFFVLNPNQSSNIEVFRDCLSCIFSQLDKSVGKNVVFVFTNTRGTEYGPGETINLLKNEIDAIRNSQPELDIPINRNIFCFDNEPFRYLAAIKKNVEFDEMIEERNSESWKNSLEQSWKLINYIVGDPKKLKPHHVKSASAINEARRMINQLMLPLIDISQLISNNVNALERHEAYMRLDNQSLDQLRSKMYIPLITLDIVEQKHPIAICTARTCAELYMVGGNSKWLYKPCQDPCNLTIPPKEIIGVPAMESPSCTICGCDFKIHMHVYYLTKAKEERDLDSVVENAASSEELVDKMKQILKNINSKKGELDSELKLIITACSKFALFLQNNAIAPCNDYFKECLEYLINREKALGKMCDQQTIKHLEHFLREYEETKSSFEEVLRLNQKIGRTDLSVCPKDINDTTQQLYKLKHNGKKIKQLYICQKKARTYEHACSERVQKIVFKPDESEGAKKKQKPKKNNDEKNKKKEEAEENKEKTEVNKEKAEANKEKAVKNKGVVKKENDPKDRDDKDKKKEKWDVEKGIKEKSDTKPNTKKEKNSAENKSNKKENDTDKKDKKEKDKNGAENKNNKKENDTDKKEKEKKEQGGKPNNKKEKSEDNKEKDKKNDTQKDDKKKKTNEKKEKDKKISDKNEQVSGNRNRQQNRPPTQGASARNDGDAPPSYYEIHQRPGYHPPPYGNDGYNRDPIGRPQGPPPLGGHYGPPHHVESFGSTHPVGAYGPPAPPSPYYPSPGSDPYRYGHDYRHPSEPPQDTRPTYNISIKLDKQEDDSKSRPLRDPYHPPPYVAPPAVQGAPYYPTPSPGAHGGPPAPYPYGSAPYDHHHGVQHRPVSNAASHANSSRQGNDRGRGGQKGKGKGRGGINKKTSAKKVNKKPDGKDDDSQSDDSD